MEPFDRILNIHKSFDGIEERWSFVFNELHQLDLKKCDIEHEMENTNFDVMRGFKKYKEFQRVRQLRRQFKNEQELLKPLYDYYEQNKKVFSELTRVKNSMTNIKKSQEKWVYHRRTEEEI